MLWQCFWLCSNVPEEVVDPWSLFVPAGHGCADKPDDLAYRCSKVYQLPAPSENTAAITLRATSAPWPYTKLTLHEKHQLKSIGSCGA